ncbi:hypothetical protein DFP72DRAFT_840240 [Ephemerocybe angulata]|uniref:Uncharacterized protein n=1 Tax=Ephemerocybe angulata TaxID=980116 RepID=A0A8H6IEN1_9AGAR|nr:hypothetical protein DFP72DRAFT_840240 [Tulosesus angulatus]
MERQTDRHSPILFHAVITKRHSADLLTYKGPARLPRIPRLTEPSSIALPRLEGKTGPTSPTLHPFRSQHNKHASTARLPIKDYQRITDRELQDLAERDPLFFGAALKIGLKVGSRLYSAYKSRRKRSFEGDDDDFLAARGIEDIDMLTDRELEELAEREPLFFGAALIAEPELERDLNPRERHAYHAAKFGRDFEEGEVLGRDYYYENELEEREFVDRFEGRDFGVWEDLDGLSERDAFDLLTPDPAVVPCHIASLHIGSVHSRVLRKIMIDAAASLSLTKVRDIKKAAGRTGRLRNARTYDMYYEGKKLDNNEPPVPLDGYA